MIQSHEFDPAKPLIVWFACFTAGTLENNIHLIAGLLSLSYTTYKFYKEYKKK